MKEIIKNDMENGGNLVPANFWGIQFTFTNLRQFLLKMGERAAILEMAAILDQNIGCRPVNKFP